MTLALGLVLCVVYVAISAGLIFFNKYLVSDGRFPHAMLLTTMHMSVTWAMCALCYVGCPSLFPAMEQTRGRRLQLLKWFVPIGLFFAVSLFASNQAYLYCSPAFLQFIKEGNVVIVFAMGCCVGLQIATRARVVILLWIVAGAVCAVTGELHFLWVGFVLQVVAQFSECSKNVMGEWLMQGESFKLDPMTYTMFVAPAALAALLVGTAASWNADVIPDLKLWWRFIIPNCFVAFALNVCVAVLIKTCSAQAFVLSGIVKDIVVVAFTAAFLGGTVTLQQCIGFGVCLSGIAFWSYARMFPGARLVAAWNWLFTSSDEVLPLLPVKSKEEPEKRAP